MAATPAHVTQAPPLLEASPAARARGALSRGRRTKGQRGAGCVLVVAGGP